MRTGAARDDSFLAAFSARVLANPRHGDFSLMWFRFRIANDTRRMRA
jgi:hypothetical protein